MEDFRLKNNLLAIIERAQSLVTLIWTPQINAEDVEIDVVNIVADELLKEMSSTDYDDIKKALVNMYFAGKILKNSYQVNAEKTLIIYNDCETIKYLIVDGDFSKFNNVIFNIGLNTEIEKECSDWLWDEKGTLKHNFTDDFSLVEDKQWNKCAIITWIP